MWAAASVSDITRIAGTTPATAPSKRSCTPPRRAASKTSSPCCESSCLLAVTTWRPESSARSTYSRVGSIPPISSTIRSLRSRMSSKSPRLRVSTPEISGRRPTSASIAPARSSSSAAKADPTVPWPSTPMRKGSAVTQGEVVVGLAADHHAGVALPAEDHGRPRHRVVVVRHGVRVRTGGRDHQNVAHVRIAQRHVPNENVAGLAVHAGDRADLACAPRGVSPDLGSAGEAVRDLGLVARAVEHRAQVVGYPAVHGHVRPNAGDALHRADGVDRHARVTHERATRLAEHGYLVGCVP